jgi:hypothetical protein
MFAVFCSSFVVVLLAVEKSGLETVPRILFGGKLEEGRNAVLEERMHVASSVNVNRFISLECMSTL